MSAPEARTVHWGTRDLLPLCDAPPEHGYTALAFRPDQVTCESCLTELREHA